MARMGIATLRLPTPDGKRAGINVRRTIAHSSECGFANLFISAGTHTVATLRVFAQSFPKYESGRARALA